MSLQVWLPFTDGTLKQQGVKNVSATAVGTVGLTDNGKLGKCATFNGGGGITLPSSTMTSFTECSVVFWINITAWNTSWDTIFQAGLNSTPWNHYIFGILRNQGNYLCFTVSNGSNSTQGGYASSNLTVGEWIHLAFTYGKGKCKIYINGILDKEYSASIIPKFTDITNIAIGRCTNGSSYQSKCKLNDFRIYDHCLSLMEVKELSKGLVLHYPLSRGGWGQENLFKKTREVFDNNGSRLSSTTVNNGLIIDSTAPNGKYRSWNVVAENNVNRGVYYTYTNSNIALEDLTANETYTLSFWSRCFKTKNLIIYSLVESQTVQKVDGGDIPSSGNIVVDNKWQRHSVTFKWTSTSKITTCFYLRSLDENVTLDIASPKLEKGDKATPWCPNSSDALATTMGLNDNIEYDTSGFGNNGTRTGTFSWTSDTPKYSVSQSFNGTDNVITLPSISNILQNSFTMNVWFRKNELGSKNYETLFGGPSGFEMDTRAGGASTLTLYMPSPRGGTSYTSFQFGEWYMVTLVNDGTNELYYINGELVKTIEKKAMPNGTYFIGAWNSITSQNYKGLMSDFRIYATALSASDVLSLYQASAYIDSQGNTFASSYVEG